MKCPKCNTENPDTQRFCGNCATPLPPSKVVADSKTRTSQTPLKELTTGSTFAGRYQIIEELGHGGMGRVYKVLDTKIKEKIALKLIKPEIAGDSEALERFGNELRLARKIRHKNICGMFDLGEAEGAHFITMEYVSGEDLKSIIQMSTGLTVGTILSVGKQVCDGLAEAHNLGIVHRDLKPQNIMIDRGGNAKIMDFGIARSLKQKGITGASTMIGTPEYMSPEQAEAKEVDARSDIYSLGIILYEMATGKVPFEGDTALSIAMKHKGETPKNPKQLNPNIPADLASVVLKCLAKEKEKRYQSAPELHAELDKIEKGLPTTERVVPEKKPLTSREITLKFTPKKLLVPGLVFFAVVIIGIIIWRVLPPKKPAPSPLATTMPAIAVLEFENKSGDVNLDNWSDALPQLLITALSQSRYIRVISDDEIYTILRRLSLAGARKYSSEDIEKIAAQTRATHVLRGSFIKAGESFIITASLQKPGTSESATRLRIEAENEKDIIVKVDELTRQVKEGLNLAAAQMAGDIQKDAGTITTSSPEALQYYIEGRKYSMKYEFEKAAFYMEKAIEIDPEFALAYRALATPYYGTAKSRRYLEKALELSARLPENERLLIEGHVFAYYEDYGKAIEVYERLVKDYPGNVIGHINLAVSYSSAGDIDKAIKEQELALQISRTALGVTNLAYYYMAKGLYLKAEDVCRSFLQDIEDNSLVRAYLRDSYLLRSQFDLALLEAEKLYLLDPATKYGLGDVLFLKGDIAGAEKVYQQVYEKDRIKGRYFLLRLALIRGNYNEALALLKQNLEESKADKEKEVKACKDLAIALATTGHREEAEKAFGQYLVLSAAYQKTAAESGLTYFLDQQKSDLFIKGMIQAEIRSFDEAQETVGALKALIDKGINRKEELGYYEYILGLIEFGKENYRKAVDFFGKACSRLDHDTDYNEPGPWTDFWIRTSSDAHASFLDGLARALYESGDLDKAWENYEKITLLTIGRIKHGDIYAKAFYMLGKIAEQQGDKTRARLNYKKFLDLWKDADPDLPEVEDSRKRLAGLKGS